MNWKKSQVGAWAGLEEGVLVQLTDFKILARHYQKGGSKLFGAIVIGRLGLDLKS